MVGEKIQADLKAAMKSGDALLVSTLRMAQSALHNKALEKRAILVKAGGAAADATLTDEEIFSVLKTEVKRRKEAAAEFNKGGRQEMAEKELKEAEMLGTYLPAEADDAAVEEAVKAAIAEVGADPRQFGRVMGLAMKKLGGTASGERVSEVARRLLGVAA